MRTKDTAMHMNLSPDIVHENIGNAVVSCYGVASLAHINVRGTQILPRQRDLWKRKDSNGLKVELHVLATHGLNVPMMLRSVTAKVRYTMKEATGLDVCAINICVDGTASNE